MPKESENLTVVDVAELYALNQRYIADLEKEINVSEFFDQTIPLFVWGIPSPSKPDEPKQLLKYVNEVIEAADRNIAAAIEGVLKQQGVILTPPREFSGYSLKELMPMVQAQDPNDDLVFFMQQAQQLYDKYQATTSHSSSNEEVLVALNKRLHFLDELASFANGFMKSPAMGAASIGIKERISELNKIMESHLAGLQAYVKKELVSNVVKETLMEKAGGMKVSQPQAVVHAYADRMKTGSEVYKVLSEKRDRTYILWEKLKAFVDRIIGKVKKESPDVTPRVAGAQTRDIGFFKSLSGKKVAEVAHRMTQRHRKS